LFAGSDTYESILDSSRRMDSLNRRVSTSVMCCSHRPRVHSGSRAFDRIEGSKYLIPNPFNRPCLNCPTDYFLQSPFRLKPMPGPLYCSFSKVPIWITNPFLSLIWPVHPSNFRRLSPRQTNFFSPKAFSKTRQV
jgi:hypothetical protein